MTGFVSLVGAGPGDPGLLTVKGRRAIERADVVLYDILAHPALLHDIDVPGQERIHVGKLAHADLSRQEAITALILKRALAGQRVCRLKGGDPFVFGRGGEELAACVAAGVPFEVVPGVTSAIAAPAYAGIPVTHRDHAHAFTIVTGHERADAEGTAVDWPALAGGADTLVILMGMRRVASWTAALVAAGRPATTSVAFTRWGTLPRQRTLVTTLGEAADAVAQAGLRSPCVAVVGAVVTLREVGRWRERQPLFGQVIGLTRDHRDDITVFEPLEDRGAALSWVPLTHQRATPERAQLAAHLAQGPPTFTDLVFTSANGVRHFAQALAESGGDVRSLAGIRTWAVGPQTAAAMRHSLALAADEVPAQTTGEGLVAHAERVGVAGCRFLFPAARGARRAVPDGLAGLGAQVDEVPVYETAPHPSATARLVSALDAGLTMITVASPSAARALAGALEAAQVPAERLPVAVIGPTTADAARELGLRVAIVPQRYTMAGLVDAIIAAAASDTAREDTP